MGGLESDWMVMKGLRLVMLVGCGVRMSMMVEKVGLVLLMMLFGLYPFRSVISFVPSHPATPHPSFILAQPASDRLTARNWRVDNPA